MTDICSNCGYCSACGRSNPVSPNVAPIVSSGPAMTKCARCGTWTTFGSYHVCSGAIFTVPQLPTMTYGGQRDAGPV